MHYLQWQISVLENGTNQLDMIFFGYKPWLNWFAKIFIASSLVLSLGLFFYSISESEYKPIYVLTNSILLILSVYLFFSVRRPRLAYDSGQFLIVYSIGKQLKTVEAKAIDKIEFLDNSHMSYGLNHYSIRIFFNDGKKMKYHSRETFQFDKLVRLLKKEFESKISVEQFYEGLCSGEISLFSIHEPCTS